MIKKLFLLCASTLVLSCSASQKPRFVIPCDTIYAKRNVAKMLLASFAGNSLMGAAIAACAIEGYSKSTSQCKLLRVSGAVVGILLPIIHTANLIFLLKESRRLNRSLLEYIEMDQLSTPLHKLAPRWLCVQTGVSALLAFLLFTRASASAGNKRLLLNVGGGTTVLLGLASGLLAAFCHEPEVVDVSKLKLEPQSEKDGNKSEPEEPLQA